MPLLRLQLHRVAVPAVALLLAACAVTTANWYVDREFAMTRYQTYAWDPAMDMFTGDPRLDNNEFLDRRVRADVERELTRRGLTAVTDAPDLLVHYHVSITQQIDLGLTDRPYECSHDEDCGPSIYDAGSLVIDLIDSHAKRLVWRGWAEGRLAGAIDDQSRLDVEIDDAVARIMRRLPPSAF